MSFSCGHLLFCDSDRGVSESYSVLGDFNHLIYLSGINSQNNKSNNVRKAKLFYCDIGIVDKDFYFLIKCPFQKENGKTESKTTLSVL